MSSEDDQAQRVGELLATPHLADAIESEQFRHFLDQIPISIAISEMNEQELIVYVNPQFEKLTRLAAAELAGQPWSVLRFRSASHPDGGVTMRELGAAIVESSDRLGAFIIEQPNADAFMIDAFSNVIVSEEGEPAFRLAALVEVHPIADSEREALEQRLREKDTLLQEIQHRVRNNLQMVTALIRLEARNARGGKAALPFDRLAGRIEALHMLYRDLGADGHEKEVDLGVYLSQIASAVMRAQAVEGIRLDLKVDTYPVSVNVAMPAGLVVNELMTNSLKHAFKDRDGGTVTLHSLVDGNGCRVIVADDGIGMPKGVEWPQRGKLSALIVQSLRTNAKAQLQVESIPGRGTRVTILFKRSEVSAESAG